MIKLFGMREMTPAETLRSLQIDVITRELEVEAAVANGWSQASVEQLRQRLAAARRAVRDFGAPTA
jgi:hypothetical protein